MLVILGLSQAAELLQSLHGAFELYGSSWKEALSVVLGAKFTQTAHLDLTQSAEKIAVSFNSFQTTLVVFRCGKFFMG